jgi:4-aminobutyrate aminotransferase-like enzyme
MHAGGGVSGELDGATGRNIEMESIRHPREPKGNAVRGRLGKCVGRGQRTYTPSQLAVEKAKGCWLWTVDGRKLIDFTSGVLVVNLGYAHAGFERLYKKYLGGLPRSSYNMVAPVEVEAAERLIKSMRSPKAQKILWAASGSEGIQKAMWAALHRYPEQQSERALHIVPDVRREAPFLLPG